MIEFKVGDKVRNKNTFVSNGLPKYLRYYGRDLVILEEFDTDGTTNGEYSLDREWFDNSYEVAPKVFAVDQKYGLNGVDNLTYTCIFANDAVGLLQAEDLTCDDTWYEVHAHTRYGDYHEVP